MTDWLSQAELERAVFDGEKLSVEDDGPDGENPWRMVDNSVKGDHNQILITDSGDSDGLGCAALYTHKFDGDVTVLPASHRNWGYDPLEVLGYVIEEVSESVPVYITDLGQSSDFKEWEEKISTLAERGHTVKLRDHHDNPERFVQKMNDIEGVHYAHDQDVCATLIALRNDYADAPEHIRDLAALTDVRDMFRTDHPRFKESELLSNVAFWFPIEYYIETAAKYGTNFDKDDEWGDYITKRMELKTARLDRVMETREFFSIHEITFGFVYGDCYHSEAGRRLIENHGADIAVIVKPSGKLSFRSSDDYPVSNDLAESFGGGGHDCAAGAGDYFEEPDFGSNDPLSTIRSEITETVGEVLV